MANELKDKLDQVEADLRGLREDKASAGRKREEAKKRYAEAIASKNAEAEAEAHKDAMEAQRAYGEASEAIDQTSNTHGELLKIIGNYEADVREKGNGNGNGAAPPVPSIGGPWSSAELLADDTLRERLVAIAHSQSKFGSLEVGQIATREQLVADITGNPVMAADIAPSTRMRPPDYQGIKAAIYRPFTFLNLIPTGTTDSNSIEYTQENPVTGAAVEVAEGAAKPEAALTFTDASAPVATIAAWMKTRKQVLADVSALRSIMDTRLRYLVQKRLEEQVLNGDGSGANLRGLLQTSGIGTVAYQSALPLGENILSGITNVYLNDGAADGIVLHPTDWQTALTQKAHFGGGGGAASTAGSYDYYGGGPFGSTPQSLWGVRVVPSQAITRGTGLVGDFSLGAQLFIRQGVTVLFSDSDQDDFIKNRVTLLAEMRAGLVVWRPSLFQSVGLQ